MPVMSNQFGSGPTALRGGGLTNFNPYAQQAQFGPRLGGGIPGFVPQPQMMPQMQARPLPAMPSFGGIPTMRPGFAPMPMRQQSPMPMQPNPGSLKFPQGANAFPGRSTVPMPQARLTNNNPNPKTNLNPFK